MSHVFTCMSFFARWFRKKRAAQLEATSGAVRREASSPPSPSQASSAGDSAAREAKTGERAGEWAGVLRSPHITEKAAKLQSTGTYAFRVAPHTTKHEVSQALYAIYGVRPVKVNIVSVRGKAVRWGRTFGRRSAYRKAYVTLPPGTQIDIQQGT